MVGYQAVFDASCNHLAINPQTGFPCLFLNAPAILTRRPAGCCDPGP
jgi:hypothetical protein